MTGIASDLMVFENAISVYKAFPNAEHLLIVNKAAIPLLTPPSPVPAPWKPVEDSHAFAGDFDAIRILADRRLDADEVSRVSGCLGYALRQTIAGEDLSDPSIFHLTDALGVRTFTALEFYYDSTKTRRDDPDSGEAFDLAKQYALSGSPIRTTNRAGARTKGTRLVEGIAPCNLAFFVR